MRILSQLSAGLHSILLLRNNVVVLPSTAVVVKISISVRCMQLLFLYLWVEGLSVSKPYLTLSETD